jgi:cellobiose-specific phosphotransferase system component IIC
MHILISPMLGNFIWVGGGSAGLVLLIIIVVLLVR